MSGTTAPTAPTEPTVLRDRDVAQRVSFLELFFDLVYVFAVTRLSHMLLSHLSWTGAGETLVLLTAVWWAWNFTAWFSNWFDPEQLSVRLVIIAIMFASLVMSAALPYAFGAHGLEFVLAYLAIQIGRHTFVVVRLRGHWLAREYGRALVWFGASAVAWLAGALVHGVALRGGLWALAVLIEYGGAGVGFPVPGLGRASTSGWTISAEHLVERCRLFVIIALGESVVITGATFGDASPGTARFSAFATAFVAVVTMWWIYFALAGGPTDSAVESASNPGLLGLRITYVHVPIAAGIIVSAVGDELVIAGPVTHRTSLTESLVLVAGPALFLAGHALFKRLMFGYVNRPRVLAVVVLAVLIPLGTLVPPLAVALAATAVLVAVAVADVRAARRLGGLAAVDEI